MLSVNDYMTNDHREVDSIFERAEEAAKAQDYAALDREASEFLRRIAVHIEIEERLLFPVFEERTGMSEAGPSVTMREEHRLLGEMFSQMRQAVDARDAGAYRKAAGAMMELLLQHNQKEEMMMYPMLDDALGGDVAALLSDVKAMANANG
jgi:iron-sulfur cluster repair protein YtfE (RIC family)